MSVATWGNSVAATVARSAPAVSLALFACGLVILFRRWVQLRTWTRELDTGRDPRWLTAILQRDGDAPVNIEARMRVAMVEVGKFGSWLKPIASTLIVLSLLATFVAMQEATEHLVSSLDRPVATAPSRPAPADASPTDVRLKNYDDFRDNVSVALTAMSRGFGANVQGVFFAAILVLLAPLLRARQTLLIGAVRRRLEALQQREAAKDDWTEKLAHRMEEALKSFTVGSADEMGKAVERGLAHLSPEISKLSEAVGGLSTAIAARLNELLTNFQATANRSWGEQTERLVAATEAVVELQKQTLTLIHRDAARVESTVETVRQVGKTLEDALARFATQLKTSMDALVGRENDWRAAIAAERERATADRQALQHALADEVARGAAAMQQQIESAGAVLRDAGALLTEVRQASEAARAAAQQEIATSLSKMDSAAAGLANLVDALSSRAAQIGDDVAALRNDLSHAPVEQMKRVADAMAEHRSAVQGHGEALRVLVRAVQSIPPMTPHSNGTDRPHVGATAARPGEGA